MEIWDKIKDWVSEKFEENLEDIEDNWEEIKENSKNILVSLVAFVIGFIVLKEYNLLTIIFYCLTAVWILFFNTLVLIRKPLYFYFSLVAILVADAIKPLLSEGINFLSKGDYLSFAVYIGVWIIIRVKFNQLKEES